MGSHRYTPGSAKATHITIQCSDEGAGYWSVTVVKAAPSGDRTISTRTRYGALSESEMADVIDIEVAQALQLI